MIVKLQRSRTIVPGKEATAAMGEVRVSHETGRTDAWRALERLDGFVRLPAGRYMLEAATMANGASAFRILPMPGETLARFTKKQWASLTGGRFYIHSASQPEHVKGCIGVQFFSVLRETLLSAIGLSGLYLDIADPKEGEASTS